jgi:hypothetical protein
MSLVNGWICPKCGKVYAPDVKECAECNSKKWVTIPCSPLPYPVPYYPWPTYPYYTPWDGTIKVTCITDRTKFGE